MQTTRFGTFHFNPDTQELFREGMAIHLQAQPAQVLAELLKQPGEIVTRETLRLAVWGSDTFVDFDRGLNFCVAQIRSALGDSAESPRFIRTVPKRGYQFIAPVETINGNAPPVVSETPVSPKPRNWILAAVAASALVMVAMGVFSFWNRSAVAPPINIAVVLFDNETINPELNQFAQNLTDTLVGELTTAGAGSFAIIGNAAILRAPRSQRDLVEIARSLNASYIILGQLQSGPPTVRIFAHMIHMPEQTHVKVFSAVTSLENPLQVQNDLGRRISQTFLSSIPSSPPPSNH